MLGVPRSSPHSTLGGDSLAGWRFFLESPKMGAVARFPTTRLSALLEAHSDDQDARRHAENLLIEVYYRPIYTHVRVKWQKCPEDAEDLIQDFFARAVERDFFRSYDRDKTRFRTFMRLCVDRFVSNANKAEGRHKRGGGARTIALDLDGLEKELARAWPSEPPDAVFDREWTRSLLAASVNALRRTCEASHKRAHLALFERYDLCPPEERPTYAELGASLGLPTTTVTNHLAWARRRFREHVLESLRELTASEDEFESEAARLLGVSR